PYLAVTGEQPPGPALLAPRTALPVRLPGPGQVTATLPPGTAALGGATTVWTGDAALTRTFPAGGVVLLANTTDAPAPATLSWTGSDPAPPLRPGTVFKRFFGASGSFELPVAGTAGARLAVAGDATLEWQGNDGAVRRGSTLAADADGRVVVSYGPGAVVLSLAAPGMSPWPEPTQSTASLPDRI